MQLTPEQVATLNSAILSDPAISTAANNGEDGTVADYLNVQTNFIVWKTAVSFDEVMNNGMDWTRVDNLTVGKARIWEWMTKLGSFNPSKANIRAGIDATWVGTAADLAVRALVYSHCKRTANRVEKILAFGTGTDTSPATLGFQGTMSAGDIAFILRGVTNNI